MLWKVVVIQPRELSNGHIIGTRKVYLPADVSDADALERARKTMGPNYKWDKVTRCMRREYINDRLSIRAIEQGDYRIILES